MDADTKTEATDPVEPTVLPAFVDEADGPAGTEPKVSLDQLLLVLAFCALWVVMSRLTILLSPWPRWVCDLAWIWLPLGAVVAAWRVHGQPLYRRFLPSLI